MRDYYLKTWYVEVVVVVFFSCYLDAPRPTLGHYWGSNLTHPMLITCTICIFGPGAPGALWRAWVPKPGRAPSEFEPGTFRFWSQRPNPLGHSPLTSCSTLPYEFLTSWRTTIEWQPSAQSYRQNKTFVNANKKILKNRN